MPQDINEKGIWQAENNSKVPSAMNRAINFFILSPPLRRLLSCSTLWT